MQEKPVADARSRGDASAALSYDALAAIVDAVDDAIISHSLDGTILEWSAGAERMLGFTAQEAIGNPIDRLLHLATEPPGADSARASNPDAAPGSIETVFHRKDGEAVRVTATIRPVYGASGELIGVTRIARDIGERVLTQARIARMNRGYAFLRAINAAIVRIRDRTELLEEACRVAVTEGGF
ncbi:MAG TPA: PAS domain-containing protein, partial [Casimicrobiaceae bacterium]